MHKIVVWFRTDLQSQLGKNELFFITFWRRGMKMMSLQFQNFLFVPPLPLLSPSSFSSPSSFFSYFLLFLPFSANLISHVISHIGDKSGSWNMSGYVYGSMCRHMFTCVLEMGRCCVLTGDCLGAAAAPFPWLLQEPDFLLWLPLALRYYSYLKWDLTLLGASLETGAVTVALWSWQDL